MAATSSPECADSHEVFDQAINSFRASLSDSDRLIFVKYAKPSEMVESITNHCNESRKTRKLGPLCKRVHRFSEAFAPFFDIINILISSHPEYSAIAWGAVRLVFMLSSNYTTFFEKLSAMLDKMSSQLPLYHEHYEQFRKRRQKATSGPSPADVRVTAATPLPSPLDPSSQRIMKIMSLLYADIIQFCQEACGVFSKRKVIRGTSNMVRDLFWTPFDNRFSKLLDRLRVHQELFDSEMSLDHSKFAEEKLCRTLETVLKLKEGRTIEQENNEKGIINALEAQKKHNAKLEASIIVQFSEVQEVIRIIKEQQNTSSARIMVEERKALKEKTDAIRVWIKAPEYMTRFENARRSRLSQTCEWFLETKEYLRWKEGYLASDAQEPIANCKNTRLADGRRHLVIRAKPGFGKTTLSSLIIEDLQSRPVHLTADLKNSQNVAFFHFESANSEATGISKAFRAILAQVFHQQRHEKHLVDAVSLLMESSSNGQVEASDDEIEECLQLFFSHSPGTIVVVDGIDECQDPATFVSRFFNICHSSETRTIIMGRPTIRAPVQFDDLKFEMHLLPDRNLEDIRLYLKEELEDMLDQYRISGNPSVEYLSLTLSAKANGMFLWAYLMVHLLQSQALSPNERQEVINELTLVNGLEKLYGRILSLLERGFAKEQERASQIFNIIAAAPQPLNISEMKILVALRPGLVLRAGDFVQNLEERISPICGALVEITADEKVQFIHSSVRECLISDQVRVEHPKFYIETCSAYARSADLCLTYLLYVAPSGPLSGFTDRPANQLSVCASLPLFRYSFLWSFHAKKSVQALPINGIHSSWHEFEKRLATFLNRTLTVTTWIEGQWLLNMRHGLDSLYLALTEASHDSPIVYSGLTAEVGRLLSDLQELDFSWAFLLRVQPHQIWGHSITAYSPSTFWYQTPETEVTYLGLDKSDRVLQREAPCVCDFSQLSGDGSCVGQLTILPSTAFWDALKRPKSSRYSEENGSSQYCSGWIVRYKIWSVRRKHSLVDIEITLPEDQVSMVLSNLISEGDQRRLLLPVCLSADLRLALVYHTIIEILPGHDDRSGDGLKDGEKYSVHNLDVRALPTKPQTIDTQFSPASKYLAISVTLIRRGGFLEGELLVWENQSRSHSKCDFRFRAKAISHNFVSAEGRLDKNFAFHPDLPFLIFGGQRKTLIWHLHYQTRVVGHVEFEEIFPVALGGIAFANREGACSREHVTGWFVTVPRAITGMTEPSRALYSKDNGITIELEHVLHWYGLRGVVYGRTDDAAPELGSRDQVALVTVPRPALRSLALSETKSNSELSFFTSDGSVRDAHSREITRLPRTGDSVSTGIIALVPTLADDPVERIVWTQEPKRSYQLSRVSEVFPPVVIERQRGNIRRTSAIVQKPSTSIRKTSGREVSFSEEYSSNKEDSSDEEALKNKRR